MVTAYDPGNWVMPVRLPIFDRPRKFTPLRRATKISVGADIALRLGLAFFLISAVVLIHWSDREGLVDNFDQHISFLDVIYFTMISITTTGFGDIAPTSDRSRLVEAIIVTPIRVAVLFIFVGTAYNYVIKRGWEKWRMARIQAELKDHLIVLGYGVSGAEAVRELIHRGCSPEGIVVIDLDEGRIAEAEEIGCNVLRADATHDEILMDVRVAQASSVLVSAGRDDTAILMVLTVRHLAPDVPISVVVRSSDNEILAKQAGANNVINPVSFTGYLLAGSAHGEHIAEYMADLASVTGQVHLAERTVKPDEIGKDLSHLSSNGRGLRIYRDGRAFGFWQVEAQKLQAGDIIVEVVPLAPD